MRMTRYTGIMANQEGQPQAFVQTVRSPRPNARYMNVSGPSGGRVHRVLRRVNGLSGRWIPSIDDLAGSLPPESEQEFRSIASVLRSVHSSLQERDLGLAEASREMLDYWESHATTPLGRREAVVANGVARTAIGRVVSIAAENRIGEPGAFEIAEALHSYQGAVAMLRVHAVFDERIAEAASAGADSREALRLAQESTAKSKDAERATLALQASARDEDARLKSEHCNVSRMLTGEITKSDWLRDCVGGGGFIVDLPKYALWGVFALFAASLLGRSR